MDERNPEKGFPSCSRAFLRVEKRGGAGFSGGRGLHGALGKAGAFHLFQV